MKISAHLHAILTAAGLDVAATIKELAIAAAKLDYDIGTNIADTVNGRIADTTFSNIGILVLPTEAGLYSLTATTKDGTIDLMRIGNGEFITFRPRLDSGFAKSLAKEKPRFIAKNQTLSEMLKNAGGKPQWLSEAEGKVEISSREVEIHAPSIEVDIAIDLSELVDA